MTGYGYGYGYGGGCGGGYPIRGGLNAAVVLVLFILLVIILGSVIRF
jgi:hypothetical protein